MNTEKLTLLLNELKELSKNLTDDNEEEFYDKHKEFNDESKKYQSECDDSIERMNISIRENLKRIKS